MKNNLVIIEVTSCFHKPMKSDNSLNVLQSDIAKLHVMKLWSFVVLCVILIWIITSNIQVRVFPHLCLQDHIFWFWTGLRIVWLLSGFSGRLVWGFVLFCWLVFLQLFFFPHLRGLSRCMEFCFLLYSCVNTFGFFGFLCFSWLNLQELHLRKHVWVSFVLCH